MPQPTPRERFFILLRAAFAEGSLGKLTLGKHRGSDPTLQNIFVRSVALKAGPRFSFVYRHATRDVAKNFTTEEALAEIDSLLGKVFLDAHLFTTGQSAQFESQPDGTARLRVKAAATPGAPPPMRWG